MVLVMVAGNGDVWTLEECGMNGEEEVIIEAHRLVLRDRKGRARIELSADSYRDEDPKETEREIEEAQRDWTEDDWEDASRAGDFPGFQTNGPEIVLFDTQGNRRLSMSVRHGDEFETDPDAGSFSEVKLYQADGAAKVTLSDGNRLTYFGLHDGEGRQRAVLRLGYQDRPELTLASEHGERLELTVFGDSPHVILRDQYETPRLHARVDNTGQPRIGWYPWRWLVPVWERMRGFYSREQMERYAQR
jgi:hypothetical protein